MRQSTINICNANINSSKYDLYAETNTIENGIHYSSSVKFTNMSNIPSSGGITSLITPNYVGTCN